MAMLRQQWWCLADTTTSIPPVLPVAGALAMMPVYSRIVPAGHAILPGTMMELVHSAPCWHTAHRGVIPLSDATCWLAE